MMNSLMLDALNKIVNARIEIAQKHTQAFACRSKREYTAIDDSLDADYKALKEACQQVIFLCESRENDKK